MFGLGSQEMLNVANSPARLLCIGTVGAVFVAATTGSGRQ